MNKSAAIYKIDKNLEKEILLASLDNTVSIGKSLNADICFNDWRTSGIHALIKKDEQGEMIIVDLGSLYGTYVNRNQINVSRVTHGDIINIGSQQLVIRHSDLPNIPEIPSHADDKTIELKRRMDTTPTLASQKNILEVLFYWGDKLLEHKSFRRGSLITVGNPKKATFGMILKQFEKEDEVYKLAKYKKGELIIDVPREAHGIIWSDKKAVAIDTLRNYDKEHANQEKLTISLRVGDSAHIEFGEMSIDFRFTQPPEKLPSGLTLQIDKKLKKILLGVLAFYLILFGTLRFFQVEEKEKNLEDIPKRLRKIVYDIGVQNAMEKRQAAIGQIAQTLEGGRARAEEGRSKAKKVVTQAEPKPAAPKQENQKKADKQKEVIKNTEKTAAVAPTKQRTVDLSSVFNESSNVEVVSEAAILAKSNEAGNTASALAGGTFARGRTGQGAGGGGSSVGIGALSGNMTGGGLGAGDYGLKPSKGKQIEIKEDEDVIIEGGLDPDLIAAIIKRYGPQIQHCYEKGLVGNPKLQGKVTTHFVIAANGSVTLPKITETTLNNATTEQCIIGKIKTWKFPRPKGGGTVGVTWPFILMSNVGK